MSKIVDVRLVVDDLVKIILFLFFLLFLLKS